MRTAIVILNWNTKDYLDKFLPGLLASVGYDKKCKPHGDAEVIIADSASTDGSLDLLLEKFRFLRRIELPENYGFTGGYNHAFDFLRQYGFEYYILLNSDIEVPSDWLAPLVEHMDTHPRCAACGPKLHSYYEKDMFEYAGAAGGYIDRFGYPFCRGRVMKKVERDRGQYGDSPAHVFWTTGAALMVRSKVYHELGGLDSRFFAHQEEIDLCWRMQLEGWDVDSVPASRLWHLGGGTLPQDSPFKLRLNFRNNLLMLSNNLAKTFATESFNNKEEALPQARRACRKAGRRIRQRMVLDGLSAAVYLLTFKKEYYKAVVQAHKEFKAMRTDPTPEQVAEFARIHAGAHVRGVWKGWIVPWGMLPGKIAFRKVRRFNDKISCG